MADGVEGSAVVDKRDHRLLPGPKHGAGPTSWTAIPAWQHLDGRALPTRRTSPASRRPPRMGTRHPIPLLPTGKPLRGTTPLMMTAGNIEGTQAFVQLKFPSPQCTNQLICKLDTGAEGNVIPLTTYKTMYPHFNVTRYVIPTNLHPSNMRITALWARLTKTV